MAVIFVPFDHEASLIVNSYFRPSSDTDQLSARSGTGTPASSSCVKPDIHNVIAMKLVPSVAIEESIVLTSVSVAIVALVATAVSPPAGVSSDF